MPGPDAALPGPDAPAELKAAAGKQPDPGAAMREVAELERRLGELKAGSSEPGQVQRLKVEPPHSAITFGGVTVGTDYTDVPAAVAADLVSEAAAAGVTITQES